VRVSRKSARIGLNVSMAVFVGFSVYGFILYTDGGLGPAHSTSLAATIFYAVSILGAIASIAWFGHQLDLREIEERRAENGPKKR
jgi:hypothetical protein